MSQTAHSGSDESLALNGHASWQHPYRKTLIHCHSDVVKSLSSQALHELRQGTEIGGMLWGKPGPADSTVILDATMVPSTGPQFNTNAVDLRNLIQAAVGHAPQASLLLLGYFRTHIRPGLTLSPQDRRLIEQQFPDPQSIFLIIKPFDAGACTAGFFFRQDGKLSEESDLEVPFTVETEQSHNQAEMPQGSVVGNASIVDMLRESAMRSQPQQRGGPRVPPSNAVPAGPSSPTARRPAGGTILIALLLAAIVTLGGVGLYLGSPSLSSLLKWGSSKQPENGVDLRVMPGSDGGLTVSWNQNAPQVRTASGGTLYITDGRSKPRLALTNAQLRSGKLLYFPENEKLQFRLELNVGNERTVAESVRVAAPVEKTARQRHRLAGRPKQLANDRDTPPAIAASAALITTEYVTVPVPPPLLPKPLSVLPGSHPQSEPNGGYVPPQVIQEMMPETSPLGQFAQTSIRVTINTEGRVVDARAAESGGPKNEALSAIAINAALQWRFHPATMNGKPVPAEYTILFAFHPQLP